MVARVQGEATQRLWDTLYGLVTDEQRRLLDLSLEVPDGARTSRFDQLRKGPASKPSGPQMVKALDRVSEIAGLGVGGIDLSGVPARRVAELARYGLSGKAPALKRHPAERRLATMLAAVGQLEGRAVDDALELLDVLMVSDLLARAVGSRTRRSCAATRRYPGTQASWLLLWRCCSRRAGANERQGDGSPCHFQVIAHPGACRKGRGVVENPRPMPNSRLGGIDD
jgi:hypothetical protein